MPYQVYFHKKATNIGWLRLINDSIQMSNLIRWMIRPLKWLLVVQTMHIVHYEYHLVKISYTIHSKSEPGMHSLIQFNSNDTHAVLILLRTGCVWSELDCTRRNDWWNWLRKLVDPLAKRHPIDLNISFQQNHMPWLRILIWWSRVRPSDGLTQTYRREQTDFDQIYLPW